VVVGLDILASSEVRVSAGRQTREQGIQFHARSVCMLPSSVSKMETTVAALVKGLYHQRRGQPQLGNNLESAVFATRATFVQCDEPLCQWLAWRL